MMPSVSKSQGRRREVVRVGGFIDRFVNTEFFADKNQCLKLMRPDLTFFGVCFNVDGVSGCPAHPTNPGARGGEVLHRRKPEGL